ncbi:MAG: hypothetical protein Roseis2KO_02220 [Roseivirga sp.]
MYVPSDKKALSRLVFINLYHKNACAMAADINYNIKLVIKDYIFIQKSAQLSDVDIKKHIYTQ